MADDGITLEQRKLYEACLEGSLKDIKECLGTDGATQYIKDGMMAMHIAACSGRDDLFDVIEFLLDSGSEVDAQTKADEDTILHLVPRHNIIRIAFPIVLNILEYKPDVSIRNRHLRSPYDEALALGYFELANILDGSKNAQEAREYYDESVGTMFGAKLVEAVMNSKEDAAKDCIKNGANVNYVNEHGAGAIHYLFTHYGHPHENILPLLFNAKADPNLRDYEGDNCLNLAIKSEKLRESGKMYKVVDQLLKKGALSTIKDLDGHDALAMATRRDYKDIVKLIRKYRAGHLSDEGDPKINTPEDENEPEINTSEQERRERNNATQVIQPAVDDDPPAPVDTGEESTKRKSTFGTVDEDDEDEEEDDFLDDPNLDIHKPNELGLFPLHQAILRTDPAERNRLVSKLLDKGADVSARAVDSDEHDEGGNTALHMAVARDQIGTVKILLQYKPLYSVPNNAGNTVLQIAEANDRDEMVEVLKAYEKTLPPDKTKTKSELKPKDKSSTCVIS